MPKQVCEICNEVFKHICSNTRCKVFYRQFGMYVDGRLTLSPKGKERIKDMTYPPIRTVRKRLLPNYLRFLKNKARYRIQFAMYLKLIGCNDFEVQTVADLNKKTIDFWWKKLTWKKSI